MADEAKLSLVHDMVTEALIEGLKGQELPEVVSDDGEVVQEAVRMAPSAAIIAAATKFLKDNNITCVPAENNKLGELERLMKERREKKRERLQPNVIDFEAARDDAAFLNGRLGTG